MYALCIITGIAVAIWLGDKRFKATSAHAQSVVAEAAITAVPCGIIGGHSYHVITSPDAYFGSGGHPLDAFKIWEGGLGIWGAIALGTFGAWWRYRSLSKKLDLVSFALFMDALAPGVLLAQAIGRFGNWFNHELFGRPLEAPWALEIPLIDRPQGFSAFETFHPTFLYEALWCTALAILLMKFGRAFRSGQVFTLYVLGYCVGRLVVESLRIDSAHVIAGLRINMWVSVFVASGALVAFLRIPKAEQDLRID